MALKNLAKKNVSGEGPAKKNGIVLELAPVEPKVNDWLEGQRMKKDGEAKMEQAEVEILTYAQPEWMKECCKLGSAENTARLGGIRVTWKSKSQFATKSSLNEERLRAVFGEEYETYFGEADSPMQLNPEALKNPEIATRLEEIIGELQQKHPTVNIVTFDSKVATKETLFDDWVLRADKREALSSKLKAAGVNLTKPTFAAR